MGTYDAIKTDQDGIDLAKLIQTIFHLQDDDKKDIMAAVENNTQLYMFHPSLYLSNANYL